MRTGRLRHRIIIKSKTVSRGASGQENITWTTVATLWGSVEPLRGNEFLESMREGAEVTTRIVVRYYPSLDPVMRVYWGSHVYDILSIINPDSRNRELQLMCKEVIT